MLASTFLLLILLSSCICSPLVTIDLTGDDWTATSLDTGVSKTINATVPGSMYMDLLRNGSITDPYKKDNSINYIEYSYRDWNYTKIFNLSQDQLNADHMDLVCDGVDTFSTVFLNDLVIGVTSDQFIQYRFPVTYVMKTNNTLRFKFESAVMHSEADSWSYPYKVPPECPPDVQWGVCHVNFARKEQASFSWDWGPAFPTMGIWKNVRIEAYSQAVMTDFSAEIEKKSDDWIVSIKAYVKGIINLKKDQKYIFAAVLIGTGINRTMSLNADELSPILNVKLKVPSKVVQLWWPNGYGNQTLYGLNVSLHTEDPDWMSKTIGFRTVELVQQPIDNAKGLTFYFKINKQSIFMKGSNWIPADSFQSRISRDRLEDLLGSAKLANMNMLRVWGGGVYERDDFYDIADKYGILIWQDFMFACAMYPTDGHFLGNVTAEVRYQVRRLKHHASLALWAGNNENEAALRDNWYGTASDMERYQSDYVTLYIDTIKSVVNEEHPSGIFVSSSPSNGKESETEDWVAQNPYDTRYGDVHYYDYNPGRYYNDDFPRTRFMSEYGYQSWPSFELIKPLTSPVDWFEFSNFSINRNHHANGQQQMNAQIRYYFNSPNIPNKDPALNFTNYIYLTHINQAMYIKMVSEFCRRSQSYLYGDDGLTMGALYWQLNDIWPGPSWSSLEFDGSWKMLHYYAKKFFAPEALSMAIEFGNLTVYSMFDSNPPPKPTNLTLTCQAWSSLSPKSQMNYTVLVSPKMVSTRLFNLNLNYTLKALGCTNTTMYFLRASLGNLHSELPLSTFKDAVGLKKATIKISMLKNLGGGFILILKTDTVAPFVWLKSSVPGTFSDNGFIMMDSMLAITFQPKAAKVGLSAFQQSVTVMSLMDLYQV